MNQFVQQIIDFFKHLDKKQTKQVLAASVGAMAVIFIIFLYLQYRQIRFFKREMENVNTSRTQIKDLLIRYEALKQEQKRGEEILARDKNFKLKDYVNSAVEKVGLKGNFTKDQISSGNPDRSQTQNFDEIKMDAEFTGINTKQLIDLINTLEENERIDIKQIDIIKKNQGIDAQLVISTLQQKVEAPPAFETD